MPNQAQYVYYHTVPIARVSSVIDCARYSKLLLGLYSGPLDRDKELTRSFGRRVPLSSAGNHRLGVEETAARDTY